MHSADRHRDRPWLDPREALAQVATAPPAVYQLRIRVDRPVTVRFGSLGRHRLLPGDYVYSGSARRGSLTRLARHLRKRKCRRWHIDHLLVRPEARVVAIRLWPWQAGLECRVNQALLADTRAVAPIAGFGSTDCAAGCPAHLLFLPAAIGRITDPWNERGCPWPGSSTSINTPTPACTRSWPSTAST